MRKKHIFVWDQAQLNVLETEWNSGISAEKIAKAFAWGRDNVERGLSILQEQGVKLRERKRRKLLCSDYVLKKLFNEGVSIRGISAQTGVSRGYIYSLLKKEGRLTEEQADRRNASRASDMHLADLLKHHRPFTSRVQPCQQLPIIRTAIQARSYCSSSADW